MSFKNVGTVWTRATFAAYLATIEPPDWAKHVCIHHCAEPSLAQRPMGHKVEYIANIRDFYRGKGWGSAPHGFTDEDQAFGMTPFTEKGTHAKSFNKNSIGLEMLGDYDAEDPKSGRGLKVVTFTAGITAELLKWLSLPIDADTILFHRDDPLTQKTCPGRKITKPWFVGLVKAAAGSGTPIASPWVPWTVREPDLPDLAGRFAAEKTFVPVGGFLGARGVATETIRAMLKRTPEGIFWGQDELELAYYDSEAEATYAPLSEIAYVAGRAAVAFDPKNKVTLVGKRKVVA